MSRLVFYQPAKEAKTVITDSPVFSTTSPNAADQLLAIPRVGNAYDDVAKSPLQFRVNPIIDDKFIAELVTNAAKINHIKFLQNLTSLTVEFFELSEPIQVITSTGVPASRAGGAGSVLQPITKKGVYLLGGPPKIATNNYFYIRSTAVGAANKTLKYSMRLTYKYTQAYEDGKFYDQEGHTFHVKVDGGKVEIVCGAEAGGTPDTILIWTGLAPALAQSRGWFLNSLILNRLNQNYPGTEVMNINHLKAQTIANEIG